MGISGMRKLAALIVLLGLAGGSLTQTELLVTVADRMDGGESQQCMKLSRAEPLCPLC